MLQTERLNHKDPTVAQGIHAMLEVAHAQEAGLLQVENALAFEQTPEGIQASAQIFIGASRAGVLLGLVGLGEDEEPNQISISVLVVDPAHQRQGIARALVDFALDQVHGSVFSVVAATNNVAAMALYRSLGFIEYKRGTMGVGALEVAKLRARSAPSVMRTT